MSWDCINPGLIETDRHRVRERRMLKLQYYSTRHRSASAGVNNLSLDLHSCSFILDKFDWVSSSEHRCARDADLATAARWQMQDSDWQLGHSTVVPGDRTLASVWESAVQNHFSEAEITWSVRTSIGLYSWSDDGYRCAERERGTAVYIFGCHGTVMFL